LVQPKKIATVNRKTEPRAQAVKNKPKAAAKAAKPKAKKKESAAK
jgi:hypothetical protein